MVQKKYNICWRNPFTGRLCYVAYQGLTLVRVEDIVKANEPKNTRLLYNKELEYELSLIREEKTDFTNKVKIISRRIEARSGEAIAKNRVPGSTGKIQ